MTNVTDIKKTIGLNLKELRTEHDLTQEKLAEHIGVDRQTISVVECGKSFISCELLTSFSNFFNVSPAFFFIPKIKNTKNKEKDLKEIKSLLPLCHEKTMSDIHNILALLLKGQYII